VPPLNLVGDYGGGALYLVAGLLAALLQARGSGLGQVVDCAMCDGAASLMSLFSDLAGQDRWTMRRGSNLLDGGAPFYRTFACSDGRHIAVGALEPRFYAELCRLIGLFEPQPPPRDEKNWPALHQRLSAIFKTRTRDEWCELLEGTDACFAPVLTLDEAPKHPHLVSRATFIEVNGVTQPAPAPRFSRTPSAVQSAKEGQISLREALGRWAEQP
jgi:alpha-methylacyl-CoA racemase